MTSKEKRTSQNAKRRLALPPSWIKNLENARKSISSYRKLGTKELEKLVGKVVENDLVQKVKRHKVLKQASKAGNELSREVEIRVRQFSKDFDAQVKYFRNRLPIPTRSEIDTLSRRVTQLSKKVDEIYGKKRTNAAN